MHAARPGAPAPRDESELLLVKGVGETKRERYGAAFWRCWRGRSRSGRERLALGLPGDPAYSNSIVKLTMSSSRRLCTLSPLWLKTACIRRFSRSTSA